MKRVVQHVAQRVPHLGRRPQRTAVITITKHGSTPTCDSIDRSRDANLERCDSRAACQVVRRFRDQVQVVRFDVEVNDPEVRAMRARDCIPDRDHEPTLSQRRQPIEQPQRDVLRNRCGDRLARFMTDPRLATRSAGARTPATVPRRNACVIECQLW
ncbi:MAG: hypothetical protein AB7T06_42200 [Kofleriaceae bacterium]